MMFNLQRFGQNDTVTSEQFLTMVYERADETNQSIKLNNSKSNNNASVIRDAMTYALNNQVFLDSKTGEVMTSDSSVIATSYLTDRTTRDLDLT